MNGARRGVSRRNETPVGLSMAGTCRMGGGHCHRGAALAGQSSVSFGRSSPNPCGCLSWRLCPMGSFSQRPATIPSETQIFPAAGGWALGLLLTQKCKEFRILFSFQKLNLPPVQRSPMWEGRRATFYSPKSFERKWELSSLTTLGKGPIGGWSRWGTQPTEAWCQQMATEVHWLSCQVHWLSCRAHRHKEFGRTLLGSYTLSWNGWSVLSPTITSLPPFPPLGILTDLENLPIPAGPPGRGHTPAHRCSCCFCDQGDDSVQKFHSFNPSYVPSPKHLCYCLTRF